MKYKSLKVMADFTSSGIWNDEDNVMVDYDELKISPELVKQFEAWIDFYDTCFKSDFFTFKKGKAKKMNEMGMWLAKELKKEMPKVVIYYWEENNVNGKYDVIKHLIESGK
jgi:hypothetical protein